MTHKLFPILLFLFPCLGLFSQNINIQDIDGNATTFSETFNNDKPTVIAFWATWCGPCIRELNAINDKLEGWQEEYDFNFAAVSIDDQRAVARVKPMVQGKAWNFPVFLDPNQDFARRMNVPTPPYTVIMNNNEVVYAKSGYKVGDENKIIEELKNIETSTTKGANLSFGLESNSALYLDDSALGDFEEPDEFRANSYLKIDYNPITNLTIGTQLESYENRALLNYTPDFESTDIGTIYANYNNGKFDITGGHFYEQFGSGVGFRAFENRQLGINTALLGGKAKYTISPAIQVTGLAGKQRVGLGFDLADSFILGGQAEAQLLNKNEQRVGLTGYFIQKQEDVPEDIVTEMDDYTNTIGGVLDYKNKGFNTSVEYITKSQQPLREFLTGAIQYDRLNEGNAIIWNAGYTQKGFGVNGTFRRLENMTSFSEAALEGNEFNQGVLNYIPALTKQQDYLLTNIYVYQGQAALVFFNDFGDGINKAGEIGGQLDMFYKFNNGTLLSMNASRWNNLAGEYSLAERRYEDEFVGFGETYYNDLSLELRHKFSENYSGIFTYLNQERNRQYVDIIPGEDNANTFVYDHQFTFNNTSSLRNELQVLFNNDSSGKKEEGAAALLEYNFKNNLSLFATDMYYYPDDNTGGSREHLYNFGASYVRKALRADLRYGRTRGGLLCVGGVCRIVTPNNGFSLNLATNF